MSVQGTDGSQLAPEEASVAKAVSGTASGRLQGKRAAGGHMPPRTGPAVGLLGTDGTTCRVISWDHFKETLPKRMPQGVMAWDRLWGVGGQVPWAIEESEEGAGLHHGAAAEKPESGASPRSPRALSAKCSLCPFLFPSHSNLRRTMGLGTERAVGSGQRLEQRKPPAPGRLPPQAAASARPVPEEQTPMWAGDQGFEYFTGLNTLL